MKCPGCLTTVDTPAFSCDACGCPLVIPGRHLGTIDRLPDRIRYHRGQPLETATQPANQNPSRLRHLPSHFGSPDERSQPSDNTGERKQLSVLFSDLSGYSALCERLDPEDVREMMNLVFKEIAGVVARYEGYIHRIIGDEVLAVFGIPLIHEDDPVRAIRAAMDIHKAVAGMSDHFGDDLPMPLAMHSGIATGMVVTGDSDLGSGKYGITGDTLNQALALTNLAVSGEIFVDGKTMSATSGFFAYEKISLPHLTTGNTSERVAAYRLLGMVDKPDKIRRVQGLRARLIGRSAEMQLLRHHLAMVKLGQGACVFVEGDAGTGKSRLISEFRRAYAQHSVDWLQGNAYAYCQDVPYFPLIDLLGRAADVHADDSKTVVRGKLDDLLKGICDDDEDRAIIMDRLFTLSSDRRTIITPEAWKIRLKQALIRIIDSQSRSRTTVICIEDLHWADPSSVDLLCSVINEADLPVLFLISQRCGQTALDLDQFTNAYYQTRCVRLTDLLPDQGEEMAKSLLRCDHLPAALSAFISDHLGGNPFYLEEVINTLVDTRRLRKQGALWNLVGTIGEAAFSSGISAVIAARLDRLGRSSKRIVQEASVIGRQFSPLVLMQIASEPHRVDDSLKKLKGLGLILSSNYASERVYRFKHTLVQEVAYNSLLKRQRRNLHEKIGQVLENQSPDRIHANCEALAYHFSKGHSLLKAVKFLKQAGRKGIAKYAVIEAHNYYAKAHQILAERYRPDGDVSRRFVELLLEWFFVFNVRGRYGDALDLMRRHEAAAMNDVGPHLKGMYLACLGWAYQRREQLNQSRRCLLEALSIGEQIHNYKVIAYSSAYLIWTCTDLGRLDEAIAFAAKAEAASRFFESEDPSWSFEMDQDLVRFVLTGTAIAYWFKGDCRQCRHIGDRLLTYGQKAGDVNSISEGYLAQGMGAFAAGDYRQTIDQCRLAIDSSVDALYTFNARFMKAYAHLSMGEVGRAEENLNEIMAFCHSSGYEYIGTSAKALSSIVAVAKGNLWFGVKAIRSHIRQYSAEGKAYHVQTFHLMLGSIYLRFVLHEGELGVVQILKNAPFFLINMPLAARKAERHLRTAIRMADRINALGVKGQASFELARLYLHQGQNHLAVELIEQCIALFGQLNADSHLERARRVLAQASSP
jgi:class 3 adenylate cyclase/tetratricopeptide (TPR) repeat protein